MIFRMFGVAALRKISIEVVFARHPSRRASLPRLRMLGLPRRGVGDERGIEVHVEQSTGMKSVPVGNAAGNCAVKQRLRHGGAHLVDAVLEQRAGRARIDHGRAEAREVLDRHVDEVDALVVGLR